jgi:hypothetical protein
MTASAALKIRLVINLKIAKALGFGVPRICSRAQPVHLVCCGG